ncbi:hypothetical protein Pelo_15730 [Pelomyxa schiedti]|nr:hypothetical protein Pelo_15730 [Pelomyxa schiedti]
MCSRTNPVVSHKVFKAITKKLTQIAAIHPGTREIRIFGPDGEIPLVVRKLEKEITKAEEFAAQVAQLCEATKTFGQSVSGSEDSVAVVHLQGKTYMFTYAWLMEGTHVLTFFSDKCGSNFNFVASDTLLKTHCEELSQVLRGLKLEVQNS